MHIVNTLAMYVCMYKVKVISSHDCLTHSSSLFCTVYKKSFSPSKNSVCLYFIGNTNMYIKWDDSRFEVIYLKIILYNVVCYHPYKQTYIHTYIYTYFFLAQKWDLCHLYNHIDVTSALLFQLNFFVTVTTLIECKIMPSLHKNFFGMPKKPSTDFIKHSYSVWRLLTVNDWYKVLNVCQSCWSNFIQWSSWLVIYQITKYVINFSNRGNRPLPRFWPLPN
jgi:uncharacterized membrane protein